MDWDALVLADGDRVEAWGRLIRDASGCWFQPPGPAPLMWYPEPPVSARGPGAVRVVGANFDQVESRTERDGAVEGYATLSGRWVDNELRVDKQTPHRLQGPRADPRWDSPPCPAPPGGWPHGERDANLDFDLGPLRDTGAVVSVVTFRPSATQAVLVVAAADVEAVESTLRPQLGARLCVLPSSFTRSEIDEVRQDLEPHWREWKLLSTGESSDQNGQPILKVTVAMVVPETAIWARDRPPGLIDLDAWLTPLRDASPAN